jgi:prepilin-type N-terminal cleavage/methylation domain-containing protein
MSRNPERVAPGATFSVGHEHPVFAWLGQGRQVCAIHTARTAHGAASCRCATRPPCRDGRATRTGGAEIRNLSRGFTMIELLVVITILLVLSTLVYAVYNANGHSDRTRSAARIGQSAFLGAVDRARFAKELRGVRLIRDTTDPTLVTGFVYLAPLPNQITGNLPGQPLQKTVTLTRPNLPNTDATKLIIADSTATAWYTQDQRGLWPANSMLIRIPAQTGTWYQLARQQATAPYWGTIDANGLNLTLQTPFQGGKAYPPNTNAIDNTDSDASCEVQLGNDLLPFHAPIPLPSSVVIDLDFSSPNVAGQWPATPVPVNIDIMFSPRGMMTGPLAALGPIHFLLNSLADATQNLNPIDPKNRGDKLILTVFPQTGLVATFPIDPTDANNDGIADDLFHFAKLGSAAGQ